MVSYELNGLCVSTGQCHPSVFGHKQEVAILIDDLQSADALFSADDPAREKPMPCTTVVELRTVTALDVSTPSAN